MNQLAMQFRPQVSTTLTSYIELTESGAAFAPALAPAMSTTEAARALVRHAHKHKALPLCGAWRLHPAQARLLERDTHGTPAGGWAAFTGVMAGTPMMQVVDAGFIPLITPDELDAWDDAIIQRALIEALTVRLAPPITAAGIFVLTGLNPFAGLTVARTLHASLPSWSARPDAARARRLEQQLAGDPLLEPVAQMFFGAVAVLLEALATLRSDHAYPIDALARFVADVMLSSQLKLAACTAERLGLFLRGEPNTDAHLGRAMDFTALDLLDGFLIPAGLARRLEGSRFCINTALLAADTFDLLFHPDAASRTHKLTEFLTENAISV